MNNIDPTNVDHLIAHILDPGTEGLTSFREDFLVELDSICRDISECYIWFQKFDTQSAPDQQFAYATAHIYALVEALYSTTKLLAHGFLAPAGNLFRVALEAMAMSVLLSWRSKVLLEKKTNKWVEGDFFEGFIQEKSWAKSHVALKTLDKNSTLLGLSPVALKLLSSSKKLYNNYSHVSPLSIRVSMITPDRLMFGGGYDPEQKDLFEKEIQIRRQFIEKVPSFLESLYKRNA